jgi:hypothetical protein
MNVANSREITTHQSGNKILDDVIIPTDSNQVMGIKTDHASVRTEVLYCNPEDENLWGLIATQVTSTSPELN